MKLKILSEHLELFRERKIYFTQNGSDRFIAETNINMPSKLKIEPYTGFFAGSVLYSMGAYSYSWGSFPISIKIGRYCSIAQQVTQMDYQHPYDRFTTSVITYMPDVSFVKNAIENAQNTTFKFSPFVGINKDPIIIGNDVWVCRGVQIKQGVKIGDGAILGARALVTKDVPPYAIVGGMPAKVIKYRFSDNIIEELLKLRWWDYNFVDLKDFQSDMDILSFIGRFQDEIAKDNLKKYEPTVLTAEDILNI